MRPRDRAFRCFDLAHLIKRDAARDARHIDQPLERRLLKLRLVPGERRLAAEQFERDQPVKRTRFAGRDFEHPRHLLGLLRNQERPRRPKRRRRLQPRGRSPILGHRRKVLCRNVVFLEPECREPRDPIGLRHLAANFARHATSQRQRRARVAEIILSGRHLMREPPVVAARKLAAQLGAFEIGRRGLQAARRDQALQLLRGALGLGARKLGHRTVGLVRVTANDALVRIFKFLRARRVLSHRKRIDARGFRIVVVLLQPRLQIVELGDRARAQIAARGHVPHQRPVLDLRRERRDLRLVARGRRREHFLVG